MNGWPPPPPWDCPNPWCYSRAGHAMEHRSRTGRPFLSMPGDIVFDPPPRPLPPVRRTRQVITATITAGVVLAVAWVLAEMLVIR